MFRSPAISRALQRFTGPLGQFSHETSIRSTLRACAARFSSQEAAAGQLSAVVARYKDSVATYHRAMPTPCPRSEREREIFVNNEVRYAQRCTETRNCRCRHFRSTHRPVCAGWTTST